MFLASAMALVLGAQAATAAPTEGQSAPPASSCELHMWSSESFSGLPYQVGIITGRASATQIVGSMEALVGPPAQLAALRSADPVASLGLPAGTKVIEHEEMLDPKTASKIKTRRAQSASSCYYELITLRHFLTEDIVWGDRFGSAYMFRAFADKPEAVRTVKGVGGNKLKVLTMSEAARPADSPELVAAALRGNFLEFAKSVRAR